MMNTATKLKEMYSEVNIYDNFNPYRLRENVEPFMGGLPIMFMTTPTMNIFSGGKPFDSLLISNAIFSYLADMDPFILKQLQYSNGGSDSPFIKILTNRFKGLNLKDFNMRLADGEFENYTGYKQILPDSNVDNFTAESSFNVTFSETKNLDITKIFYAWMCYIEAVRYGLHDPADINRNNRVLDFTSSIYFFILDFDMRTILYFCKYTGVYPNNVPLSGLVMSDITSRGAIDTTITFTYQYKEEFTPHIIYDFNMVSNNPANLFNYTRPNVSSGNTTMQALKSQYGYGGMDGYDPSKDYIQYTSNNASSSSMNKLNQSDGRDFLYEKNYDTVSIKFMKENNYSSESQSAFNSAEPDKKTLVMCFESKNNSPGNSSNVEYTSKYDMKKYNQLAQSIRDELNNQVRDLYESAKSVGATELEYQEYLRQKEKDYKINPEYISELKQEAKEILDKAKKDRRLNLITEEQYKEFEENYKRKLEEITENLKTNKEKYDAEVLTFDKYQFSNQFMLQRAKTINKKKEEANRVLNSDMINRFMKYFGGFM